MVAERLTTIPLTSNLAKRVQTGDMLNVEVTLHNVFPHKRVLRAYRVMIVDRINELVECSLLNEKEV